MRGKGKAFFVLWPRRISDLQGIHPIRAEKPYEIHRRVSLGAMDYENFAHDLRADRSFLDGFEDNRWDAACFRCVFVHQRGKTDGVLVVPTTDGHVRYAAYRTE